jgi:hypothetical protein
MPVSFRSLALSPTKTRHMDANQQRMCMHMKPKVSQLAAAAAIVGFLGFGGVSLAAAQDESTTTEDPSATTDDGSATTDDGSTTEEGATEDGATEDCPHMGEGGGRRPGTAPGETPSEDSTETPSDDSTETPSAEASSL